MCVCVIPSPIGNIAIREAHGAISAVSFTADEPCPPATPLLTEAARQLCAYFDGTLTDFDLPVLLEGSAFRMQCWQALQTIPYGDTISYGEQARRIGNPKAVRAVGGANHHNPISIIVPCHRVVGADGGLTGYGGGMEKKQWLLEHEKRNARTLRMDRLDLSRLSSIYAVRRLDLNAADEILAFCQRNAQYYAYCGAIPSLELIEHDLVTAPPGIPAEQKYYLGFYLETKLIAVMDLITGYPDSNYVFIGFFMMDSDLHGLGIGSRIISEALHAVKLQGFSKCLLGFDKDNPQSSHFWQKNGFQVIREAPQEDAIICVAQKQL